jgi:hypothetical protein
LNEILTNEEIDTLLQMFRNEGGALEPETDKAARAAVPVPTAEGRVISPMDLLKPNRLGR